MISNTSRSGLKLVDKVELFSSGYQQKRQLSTSNCGNNNNNDDVSTKRSTSSSTTTLQLQNTSPFTFYSSATGNVTSPTECATIIIQRSSSEQIPKNVLPLVIQPSIQYANECIQNKPCNFYHSKQENELQEKCFNKFCKNSALSSDLNKKSGEISTTEVTSGDISNNCSCYSSNNIQQKLPICRTQDQEHAFRQIEDVHNYSKLNRYRYYSNNNCENVIEPNYSSNSSNQDEEDEDEEEVEGEGEGEEELEEELDEHDMAHYEQDTHKKQKTSALVKQQNQKICNIGVDDNVIRWNHQQKQQINVYNSSMEKLDPKENNDINNSPPDHHARRPMNAFLIFCKRHRGIVKDRYKHFENRSITKILGEWWASLDVNDKKCYVNLAKQNKDAFFSANPNFKWYKLPAPSLRTLNTRPGNNERPLAGSGDFQSNNIDSTSQGTESYAIHPSCSYTRNEPKKVSYFKLADETQMGELNNLMRPIGTPSNNDVLHEMLGETSDYFKSGCKRKSITCFDDIPSTKRLNIDNSFSSSEDDLNIKKSVRSCKGKKYQELMNSGQIAAVTPKKQVQSKAVVANVSSNNDLQTLLHNECLSKAPSVVKDAGKTIAQSKTQERCLLPEFSDSYESHIKQQFNFVSFDLEDKIKALPAQCLETYLQRKKNTKRKKKINSKKRSAPKLDSEAVVARSHLYQSKTIREVKEQIVGSQKRKARKESITRRDINSMQNDVQVLLSSGSVSAIVIGNNASANVVDLMPKSIIEENQDVTPDLLILAEVASNDTGIAQ